MKEKHMELELSGGYVPRMTGQVQELYFELNFSWRTYIPMEICCFSAQSLTFVKIVLGGKATWVKQTYLPCYLTIQFTEVIFWDSTTLAKCLPNVRLFSPQT